MAFRPWILNNLDMALAKIFKQALKFLELADQK